MWSRNSIASMEKLYPAICALISFIICIVYLNIFGAPSGIDLNNILNAIITFASIIVGFIGVLLGLVFSISNSEIIIKMFQYTEKDVLKHYFMTALISGVLLICVSVLLYLKNIFSSIIISSKITLFSLLAVLWVAIIIYMLLSSWRIINIIMHIVFSSESDNNKVMHIEMDDDELRHLQEKYKE